MLKPGIELRRTIIITGRTDLRKGAESLTAYVRMYFDLDPLDKGTLFLFCGTKRDRVKGVFYEGDGIVLVSKHLTNGAFQWPRNSTEARALTTDQYERLMTGFSIDASIKVFR